MPSRGGGAHTQSTQSTQSTQGNQSAHRIDTPREEATTGTVKWFNAEKGYGLITVDGDPPVTVYVHYSAIQMDGHQTLEEGRRVEFVISQGQKGRQADDVRYLR